MSSTAIPLNQLFGKTEASLVKVSPGGKWIAWLARTYGVLNIWLAPLPLSQDEDLTQVVGIPSAIQVTAAVDRDICFSYRFTNDDKRIVYIRETTHGSEFYHLYVIDLSHFDSFPVEAGTDILADYPKMTCAVGFVGGLQLWLTSSTPNTVTLSTGCGSLLWDLSTVDIDSGELVTIQKNPADSYSGCALLALLWLLHLAACAFSCAMRILSAGIIDINAANIVPPPALPLQYFVDELSGEPTGRAEMVVSWGIHMRFTHFVKSASAGADGRWEQVGPAIAFADLNMQLVGSGGATGTMRLDRLDENGRRVAIHTCSTGDKTAYVEYPGGKVLATHPRADLDGFIMDPSTGDVVAVLATTSHTEILPLNSAGEKFKQAVLRISAALGLAVEQGEAVCVVSRTRRDDVWVLCSSSDTEAGTYYLLQDPYSDCSPRYLLSSRPALRRFRLTTSAAIDIPSRDGELLPCYLTAPIRHHGSPLAPLALLLHGGPSARDYAGYDPIVQLLVSRGIAVLKVNYRGSTGYGKRYLKLGSGGLQGMHNDVEDARLWAIDMNLADEKRIAVIGASWGGYLALGAATGLSEARSAPRGHDVSTTADTETTQHPYAAVVAIVPVVCVGAANTSTSFRGDPIVAHYWRGIYGEKVSTFREEAEKLSPLFHLEQLVGTKLWLIHGEDDIRVPREHGDMVASKARSLGIPGGHVTYAHEGHHIRKEPNVLHMWHGVYQFLMSSLAIPPNVDEESDIVALTFLEGNTATVHHNTFA